MNIIRALITVILLALLTVSCASSMSEEASISTAVAGTVSALPTETNVPATSTTVPTSTIAPTETPEPSPTPGPVELTDLDLVPLLVYPGDLPAKITPGQVRAGAPSVAPIAPNAVLSVEQELANVERRRQYEGFVAVLLYDNNADYQTAFDNIVNDLSESILEPEAVDVGDVGLIASTPVDFDVSYYRREVVFARCGLVVLIRIFDVTNAEITAYAQRIDGRISELCE